MDQLAESVEPEERVKQAADELVESLVPKCEDHFEDLAFLKEVLKDKRIVMLGESSHGSAVYPVDAWIKEQNECL